MKTLISKSVFLMALALLLDFSTVQESLGQTFSPNTPYPIIFVHGINSCDTTWGTQNNKFDNIIDYLHGAGLKAGGAIKICLSYQRSMTTLNTPVQQDVVMLTSPGAGDYYIINFNVLSNGKAPIVHQLPVNIPGLFKGDSTVVPPQLTTLPAITGSSTKFSVSFPDEFRAGDVICMDDEFMGVTAVSGNTLTVKRGRFNSLAIPHLFNAVIHNISNESNQASIVKQGYALKLAIDAIKLKTGAKKVILVGHSMGGLAIREYVTNYASGDVAKIVTIGTPHYGADISDLPDDVLNIVGVDGRSNATRDLRATINLQLGVYLFGGSENAVTGFYSSDVNADGLTGGNIIPLNGTKGYTALQNIAHTWITSVWTNWKEYLTLFIDGPNDGVVLTKSQLISSKDTLCTTGFHTDEPRDYYTLLRGLDEPSDPALAYEINENSTTRGFITFGQASGVEENPYDVDLFKVTITQHEQFTIKTTASAYTGISSVKLLNTDQSVRQSIAHLNQSITDVLDPGTYFIQVNGTAGHGKTPDFASYKYPYTVVTSSAVIPPSTLSTIPDKSLNYYDEVIKSYRDTLIQLTNNSQAPLVVSNLTLSGSNPGQFAIQGTRTFTVGAGQTQNIIVRFLPTTTGAKTAQLQIADNSTDLPLKTITLSGQGVSSTTKTMVADASYNFGSKTIDGTLSKIFTVQNTGSGAFNVTSLKLMGADATQFSVSPLNGFGLGSNGGTATFTVNFLPASVGSKSAQLILLNNSTNSSPGDTIAIFGNGTNDIYTGITGTIAAWEYWFDDNYSAKVHTSINSPGFAYLGVPLPAAGLISGRHDVHIRYEDQKGDWSPVLTKTFYKPAKIVAAEYWFDANYAAKITIQGPLNLAISTGTLSAGNHQFNIRYKDDVGQWTAVTSRQFVKPANIISYEYWFDDNYTAKTSSSITPGQTLRFTNNISSAGLTAGPHHLHIRYKDGNGTWSGTLSEAFIKPNLLASYRYWFDTDVQHITTVDLPVFASSATVPVSLLAGNLGKGNHILHLQYKDVTNAWSTAVADTFAVGAPVITFGPMNAVVYGAPDIAPGAVSSSGGAITYSSADTVTAKVFRGKLRVAGAGNTVITATDAAGSAPVSLQLIVDQAPLTIKANDKTKVAGAINPGFLITYSGFVNGEDRNNLLTLPVAKTTATKASPPGVYPVNVSGATSLNYSFIYVPGILTITAYMSNSFAASLPTTDTAASAKSFFVNIYPNPTSTVFNLAIQNGDPQNPVTITVKNLQGTTLYQVSGDVGRICTFGGDLPMGVYIADIINGRFSQQVKLIKVLK